MGLLRAILAVAVLAVLFVSSPNAAPEYSSWSPAVNIGPAINTAFAEAGPAVSKNDLSFYFHSERPRGSGSTDIWVSQRERRGDPWGPPVNLGTVVNSPSTEAVAALSRDEHWLFFTSSRPGGVGGTDIWVSYREHVHDPFDWQAPVNVGTGVNSPFNESGATYFENDGTGAPQLFFHSNRPGVGGTDLYVSDLLGDGTFGPATMVAELSGPGQDQRPSIRFDGLEIFFFSDRPGGAGFVDLWSATRARVFDPWSAPTNLGPAVNTVFDEVQPYISADRQTLYFQSARPVGGFGSQDIWMTTRKKH
jgi:hypothetical protein